jgi:mannosidase alpha-like ER degradation enhancer 2
MSKLLPALVLSAALIGCHNGNVKSAAPPASNGQAAQDAQAAQAAQTRAEVKEAFRHAWSGYVRYAWGHDALRPLSKGYRDWYDASLLMTPVDALDTMILMGLDDEARQARELVDSRLSFDKDISVSTFEITIRLLGGLLSAYELTSDPKLLALATDLGNRLLPAFSSPTGMPYTHVNLRTGAVTGPVSNPAEIGTLVLEFGVLGKLTHNPVYYDKAKAGVVALFRRASPLGLVGSEIDVETGEWKDTDSHVGGGIDSYYEYLYKSWLLFGDADFLHMWEAGRDAMNRYLADEWRGDLWYGHAHMQTGARAASTYGALDAFLPALIALSGDVERARRLQDSTYKMWNLNGIEPEVLDYRAMQVMSPGYQLRPEIVESAYYLRELTGDVKYQEMGRALFLAIKKHCFTGSGFAALSDVRSKQQADSMESYFFAETLKYAYLLFAPRGTVDLGKRVFNTEAHLFTRQW